MMLDWLGEKFDHPVATEAAMRIETAVDKAFAGGIKPFEFGGRDGTMEVTKAVLAAL
jgi:3-isopropylmalate dehydrogenase